VEVDVDNGTTVDRRRWLEPTAMPFETMVGGNVVESTL
jgi:hypothetical protein